MKSPRREKRIEEVFDLINLHEVRNQPIETLSKGFKRRVGLAQAILHDPDILILDEPTDGLDPNQKHEVRSLIQHMAKTKAIILSTHVLEEVDSLCNRVIIIAGGKIVADGTPAELERQAPSYGAITVTVDGSKVDHIQATLSSMVHVQKFEVLIQNDKFAKFRIFPEKGRNLVHDINSLSQENHWDISEMFIDRGRLEETFRAMTYDKQERT
jgi:ABC-2 type transport system ATP-binding protein